MNNHVDVNVCGVQSLVPCTYKTVVLKPNVIDDKNILTQSMMNKPNTKYVIKYDFLLSDAIVEKTVNVVSTNVSQCGNAAYAEALAAYNLAHDAWIDADNAYTNDPNDTTLAAKNDAYAALEAAQLTLNGTPQYYYFAGSAINIKKGQHVTIPEGCVLLNDTRNGIISFDVAPNDMTVYIGSATTGNYDYKIQGGIEMPANCLIEFDGGSISDGVLIGDETILIFDQEEEVILKNVELLGDFEYSAGGSGGVDKKDNVDGMATITLKKNKSFASQLTQPNTIYRIVYDFDLDGETVTIPENCVLEFDGGSINGGKIQSNNTILTGKVNSDCLYGVFKDEKGTYLSYNLKYPKELFIEKVVSLETNRGVNYFRTWILASCTSDDNFIYQAAIKSDNSQAKIVIFDRNFNFVGETQIQGNHCNSMTIMDGVLYIVHGYKCATSILLENAINGVPTTMENFDSLGSVFISYDADFKLLYTADANNLYIQNSSFELISTLTSPHVYIQNYFDNNGFEGDHLYYNEAFVKNGVAVIGVSLKNQSQNGDRIRSYIAQIDITYGTIINIYELNIKNSSFTEVEGITLLDDNTFLTASKTTFKGEHASIEGIEYTKYTWNNIEVGLTSNILYVDNDYTGISLGNAAHPYKSIEDAISRANTEEAYFIYLIKRTESYKLSLANFANKDLIISGIDSDYLTPTNVDLYFGAYIYNSRIVFNNIVFYSEYFGPRSIYSYNSNIVFNKCVCDIPIYCYENSTLNIIGDSEILCEINNNTEINDSLIRFDYAKVKNTIILSNSRCTINNSELYKPHNHTIIDVSDSKIECINNTFYILGIGNAGFVNSIILTQGHKASNIFYNTNVLTSNSFKKINAEYPEGTDLEQTDNVRLVSGTSNRDILTESPALSKSDLNKFFTKIHQFLINSDYHFKVFLRSDLANVEIINGIIDNGNKTIYQGEYYITTDYKLKCLSNRVGTQYPIHTTLHIGDNFFRADLGVNHYVKDIASDGTVTWVDATGATV